MDIKRFATASKYTNKAEHVQNFLAATKFKVTANDEQGISWIELYTLYKLAGGPCMIDDPINKAAPKIMMRHQLKAFIENF